MNKDVNTSSAIFPPQVHQILYSFPFVSNVRKVEESEWFLGGQSQAYQIGNGWKKMQRY
jgi:hypothetical protein